MTESKPSPRPPVIGVAGWKGSGKTTLVVRLIEEFTRRGLRVATAKHAHHAIDIDDKGSDSARHRRAGARQTAVISGPRWALVTELGDAPEPTIDDVIGVFDPCDLVIVEGYKTAAIPKIEVRRLETQTRQPLAERDPWVIAVAADHQVGAASVPVFGLDDIPAIADFIARTVGPLVPPAAERP